MEKTKQNVFKTTEKEENSFEKQNSDQVDGYVNTIPTTDLNKLNIEDYHSRKITWDEIKTHIRRSIKKASGYTKVNIQLLQNCTYKTLEQFKNLFNECLSIGYSP